MKTLKSPGRRRGCRPSCDQGRPCVRTPVDGCHRIACVSPYDWDGQPSLGDDGQWAAAQRRQCRIWTEGAM